MSEIVAEQLVEQLTKSGYVIMQKPAMGVAALGRGHRGERTWAALVRRS